MYVISIGCGESRLITLDAIDALARADVFVCSPEVHKRYAHYMGGRPVLFDPVGALIKVFHQKNPNLSKEEKAKQLKGLRDRECAKIVDALEAGKNVGFLDFGDPGIFGTWRFIGDYVDESQIETVPGISAFNASNATIGKDITCRGTIVITAPEGLESNQDLVKAVAEEGDTLAIFMGLKKIDRVHAVLKKHYDPATPVTIVYNAGYEVKGRLVPTTVKDLRRTVLDNSEEWLGVIYVGPCMTYVGPAAR